MGQVSPAHQGLSRRPRRIHGTRMKPYTPETLAERWDCSPSHIRNLIDRGDLRSFRLGRLIRIPPEEVTRIECQSSPSNGCEADTPSNGTTRTASRTATSLPRLIGPARKQRREPVSVQSPVRQGPWAR